MSREPKVAKSERKVAGWVIVVSVALVVGAFGAVIVLAAGR